MRAAFVSLTSDAFNGRIHYITGPRAISFHDVAAAFSKSLGKDIRYINLSYEDQKAGLEAYGTPDAVVEAAMTLFKRWTDGEDQPASPDFERMAKTKATDIDQFAADVAGSL